MNTRARNSGKRNDLPIKGFASARKWAAWLARNCARSQGVWVRFFKKASGMLSVTYAEALEEALCHGWIDGQVKKYDKNSYLQRFTPRRARSLWSKRNVGHALRLIKEGRMTSAGLTEIEAAKSDGRWERAYDSPSTMQVPEDFIEMLSMDTKANEFFKNLDRANTYAIVWRLQTARTPEARARRVKTLLEMLSKGEKLH